MGGGEAGERGVVWARFGGMFGSFREFVATQGNSPKRIKTRFGVFSLLVDEQKWKAEGGVSKGCESGAPGPAVAGDLR